MARPQTSLAGQPAQLISRAPQLATPRGRRAPRDLERDLSLVAEILVVEADPQRARVSGHELLSKAHRYAVDGPPTADQRDGASVGRLFERSRLYDLALSSGYPAGLSVASYQDPTVRVRNGATRGGSACRGLGSQRSFG
jgi:hypothetical protein